MPSAVRYLVTVRREMRMPMSAHGEAEGFVGQRGVGVFVSGEIGDLLLDRLAGDFVAGHGQNATAEELPQGNVFAAELNGLSLHSAADGGDVQPQQVGHFLHGQGAQILAAEEIPALVLRQRPQDHGEGAAAVVHAAHKALGLGQLFLEILADGLVAGVAYQGNIVLIDGYAGEDAVVIELNGDPAVFRVYNGVRNAVLRQPAGVEAPRGDGVESRDDLGGVADFVHIGVKESGQLLVAVLCQKGQPLPRQAQGEGVQVRPLRQLQDQALRQIPRGHPGGIQHLHGEQRLLHVRRRAAQIACQRVYGRGEIAPLVQTFRKVEAPLQPLPAEQGGLAELRAEILREGLLRGGELLQPISGSGLAAALPEGGLVQIGIIIPNGVQVAEGERRSRRLHLQHGVGQRRLLNPVQQLHGGQLQQLQRPEHGGRQIQFLLLLRRKRHVHRRHPLFMYPITLLKYSTNFQRLQRIRKKSKKSCGHRNARQERFLSGVVIEGRGINIPWPAPRR